MNWFLVGWSKAEYQTEEGGQARLTGLSLSQHQVQILQKAHCYFENLFFKLIWGYQNQNYVFS